MRERDQRHERASDPSDRINVAFVRLEAVARRLQ